MLTRKITESYRPLTNRQAWETYDRLCEDDAVIFAEEPPGLDRIWRQLAHPGTASPKLWMDAYLAAFAIAGKMRLVTLDHNFKSFEEHGLDLWLLNP